MSPAICPLQSRVSACLSSRTTHRVYDDLPDSAKLLFSTMVPLRVALTTSLKRISLMESTSLLHPSLPPYHYAGIQEPENPYTAIALSIRIPPFVPSLTFQALTAAMICAGAAYNGYLTSVQHLGILQMNADLDESVREAFEDIDKQLQMNARMM